MDDNAIVQRYRLTLREGEAALRVRYFAKPEALPLLHGLSRLVDRILRGMWKDFAMPASHALVAVGGYGRGELYPHSDVDVLILRPEPVASDTTLEETEQRLGRFLS